jgi:hypothetical protein
MGNIVGREIQRHLLAADGVAEARRRFLAAHRHGLHPAAVRIAGFQAQFFKFLLDVGHGFGFAGGAGRAAFKLVGGQRFDVLQQILGRDGVQRLGRRLRQRGQGAEREGGKQQGRNEDMGLAPCGKRPSFAYIF